MNNAKPCVLFPSALAAGMAWFAAAAYEPTFGVDIRTTVSATVSTFATRIFYDDGRTPVTVGTRLWFVIDQNGDGVPAAPNAGAILGPDDVLILEDVVAGQLPATPAFSGRYARNGFMVASNYLTKTNVYVYVWDFARPLTEVPQYQPPAGTAYGVLKMAVTPKPEIGNAVWRIHEDVFARARTVGGEGGELPPTITTPPRSQSVKEGQRVEFTVLATGTEPLSYQWQKDGADLPGATNATFVIAAVSPADAGMYTVLVRNRAGSRTSEAARLTVLPAPPPPQITGPSITTENGNTFLNFSFATVSGTSYQVQSTLDLAAQPVVWTNEGDLVSGTGTVVVVRMRIGSAGQITPPQKFLRVVTE